MAYFLPLISILYGGVLPAGLFIYWITATIIQIVQQYLILGWGGMFPLFGWYPEFARNHTPRFPVKMPEPKPTQPGQTRARRSARNPSTGTSRPSRRSGPTERGAADEGDDADHERIPGVHRQVRRGGHQVGLRRVRRRPRRPRLRDPDARAAAACWGWAPSPPGSSPPRAAPSVAPPPSARPPSPRRCRPRRPARIARTRTAARAATMATAARAATTAIDRRVATTARPAAARVTGPTPRGWRPRRRAATTGPPAPRRPRPPA